MLRRQMVDAALPSALLPQPPPNWSPSQHWYDLRDDHRINEPVMHARCARLVWLGPTPPKLEWALEQYLAKHMASWPTQHPPLPPPSSWSLESLRRLTDATLLSFERLMQRDRRVGASALDAAAAVQRDSRRFGIGADRGRLKYALELADGDLRSWGAKPESQSRHEAAIIAVARAMLVLDEVKAHEARLAQPAGANR